jgi:hypothetical protein
MPLEDKNIRSSNEERGEADKRMKETKKREGEGVKDTGAKKMCPR